MHHLVALIVAIVLCAPLVQAQAQQPCKPPAPLTISREQNIFTEEQEADLGDAMAERTIARLDLMRTDIAAGSEIKEDNAMQIGPFMMVVNPAKKDGSRERDVIIEVRDVRSYSILWSKPFPKEAPAITFTLQGNTISFLLPVSSEAARAEIQNDAALTRQLAAMNEKEGDFLLQAFDIRTGKPIGRLLIETGKGSFRISDADVVGDQVVIFDTRNRIMVYSLSSGEQKGKIFGSRAAIHSSGKLLGVENECGQLTIYDLPSMEKRDEFIFPNRISLMSFAQEGKSLFVLTANQTAYVLDVSALIK
ncbi:MAG: hypothetical protein WBV94_13455 [Blastocatellia bacterium]